MNKKKPANKSGASPGKFSGEASSSSGPRAKSAGKYGPGGTAARPNAPKKARPPATAFQRLVETVKWVDLIIEVLDGRLPLSTRHPASAEIFGNKPRLLIYSKSDLSDLNKLKAFVAAQPVADNARVLILDLKSAANKSTFIEAALAVTADKRASLAGKGLLPRPVRACVVGIPNVGKSSLINWFIGRKRARTGDMPGVTRGTQWIRVHPQLELLDTPGILPPTLFGPETRQRLAFLNLVPADSYEATDAANFGLMMMRKYYPKLLEAYEPGLSEDMDGLDYIALKRSYLVYGGKLDHIRAANIFLRDVRAGKLGHLTLDHIAGSSVESK